MSDAPATARATEAAPRALPGTLLRSVVFKFGIYGVNALTGIVTARALHPAGRGELVAMTLWPILLAGVSTVGLPSAIVYHTRKTPDRAPVLIGCALVMSAAAGAVATVIGWLVVPLWLRDQPAAVVDTARFCIVATTAIYAQTLVTRAVWEARGLLDRSHLLQLISPVLTLAALVPQAAAGMLTSRAAAYTYILAGVPAVVWSLTSIIRHYRPTIRGAGATWRRLVHFGARSYGVDVSATLSIYLDQALVVGLLRPEAMGLYVVALNLSRILNAVQGSVALMAFPRLVGVARETLRSTIARSARLSAIVSGALGLLVVVFGTALVQFLYGPSFESAGRLLPLLVAEVVTAGVAQVLLQGFLASGRPGVATLIQVSTLAVSVPIFLVLVPAYGAWGAAAGLLTTTVIRLALTLAAYPVFLSVPAPRVWLGAADLADLAAYRGAARQFVSQFGAGGAK